MTSTALEHSLPTAGGLMAAPVYDEVNERKLALITATVAKGASREETALFLELCAKYELDPFAREAWCVKGRGADGGEGRLLIMVGRDGLRKIAQRNNIHIDGDVVHEKDSFTVTRTPTGNRTVAHSYGKPSERGDIIGAWAECREGGPEGRPLGFFYAAMSEYKPTNAKKLQYSPWGSQESVMILAAAERQALRQATPLSGLLVEGEGERNDEVAAGTQTGGLADTEAIVAAIDEHIPSEYADSALDLINEMNSLAPNSWTASKIEMVFSGKTAPYSVTLELAAIEKAIEELRARPVAEDEVADAEVVDEIPASEELTVETPLADSRTPEQEAALSRIADLEEAIAEGDLNEQQKSDALAEIESLEASVPAEVGPNQDSLPL